MDLTSKDYSCTPYKPWILVVTMWLFTMCKHIVVASKTRYRLILDGWCLVICRCTACSRLALAHWCQYARLTLMFLFVKKLFCPQLLLYTSQQEFRQNRCSKRWRYTEPVSVYSFYLQLSHEAFWNLIGSANPRAAEVNSLKLGKFARPFLMNGLGMRLKLCMSELHAVLGLCSIACYYQAVTGVCDATTSESDLLTWYKWNPCATSFCNRPFSSLSWLFLPLLPSLSKFFLLLLAFFPLPA